MFVALVVCLKHCPHPTYLSSSHSRLFSSNPSTSLAATNHSGLMSPRSLTPAFVDPQPHKLCTCLRYHLSSSSTAITTLWRARKKVADLMPEPTVPTWVLRICTRNPSPLTLVQKCSKLVPNARLHLDFNMLGIFEVLASKAWALGAGTVSPPRSP